MKKGIFSAAILALALVSCVRTGENYTVVVSLDAFRHDYPDIYPTRFLHEMAENGVRATMEPSFPASTFPNHYTMATGLVPDHNGIVNTAFWDKEDSVIFAMRDDATRNNPKYYLGETVWNTAERQGVRTGTVYWVGSDIPGLPHATYYKDWCDEPRLDFAERADEVVRLLGLPKEERPHLVMAYFDEPDGAGHRFGPATEEVGTIVEYLDSLMGDMYSRLKALPHGDRINLIITSDHGMASLSNERFVSWEGILNEDWCEKIVYGTPVSIFAKEGYCDSIVNAMSGISHIDVWRKSEIPEELHYGSSDRVGDVIICPEVGWGVGSHPHGTLLGGHGFRPQDPDMQVVFFACGPDFKRGKGGFHFRNVDIYPMLCRLLGVEAMPVDGDIDRIKGILK